jgi:hypothetical protein
MIEFNETSLVFCIKYSKKQYSFFQILTKESTEITYRLFKLDIKPKVIVFNFFLDM